MNERMKDKRLAEIDEWIKENPNLILAAELLQALKTERLYKDRRIAELEAECDQLGADLNGTLDRAVVAEHKYKALVIRVKTVVDQHHFGDSIPKALILVALEDNDEN